MIEASLPFDDNGHKNLCFSEAIPYILVYGGAIVSLHEATMIN
jgi:hypothetical protein